MSPFGSDYRWSTTMSTISYYVLRRILGAIARVLDRMERRERERREQLRAHPEGGHMPQTHRTPPSRPQKPESARGCMCPTFDAQETP